MSPGAAVVVLWVGWALSWAIAAVWSNPTERRPGAKSQLLYRALMVIGGGLMATWHQGLLRCWSLAPTSAWASVFFIAIGLVFAWWARIYLGRLWSGNITLKVGHRVVDTGPYGLVRHPIYTGLLLALLATAVFRGTVLSLGGFALLLLGIWVKARQEERWLTEHLGQDAYSKYRQRVPMLVPFWPR